MPFPPLTLALRDRLAALRYDASPDASSKRDLRIDLLRGFCVFVMIVDHVGGESSWLYALTGGNRFFVSAAEGFVLLSGVSMGMVHRGVIQKTGIRGMLEKVFGRAWFLYALTVILTITFAAASAALGTPWAAAATPAKSGVDFVRSVLTFHRSYSLTDVLVLYTLLVLAAGPALWLVARGHTALVLVSSWSLWALAQVWPGGPPQPWAILDGGFPFAAWQVLFFSGLVIGYHRQRLARWLAPSRTIAAGIAGILALVAVEVFAQRLLGVTSGIDVQQLLFDKNDARIGRVLALLVAASFGWSLATIAWVPVRRATAWLLLRFGKQALFAYGVQLFVVAFWDSELMAPVRLDRENALFQGAAVLMVWAACVAWPRIQGRLGGVSLRRLVAIPAGIAAAGTLVVPLVVVVSVASATEVGNDLLPTTAAPIARSVGGATDTVVSTAGTLLSSSGRIESSTFYSRQLGREMPITVYLPPRYDDTAARYPTVYMLHGGGGSNTEWIDDGLLDAAERLMSAGEIPPMIVVLPQGDQEYWVDHVVDAWAGQAEEIAAELGRLGIARDLDLVPGDHSMAFWSAHVEDFLRYFSATLRSR